MKRGAKLIAITLIVVTGTTGCTSQSQKVPTISRAAAIGLSESSISTKKSVIALANGSAEIISALGLKRILVGRDIASTDSDLKNVPVVTSGHQVIPEKIISLAPDLVIIDAATGPAQAISTLRKAGIDLVTIKEAWTLADIERKVLQVSAAIGAQQAGQTLSKEITGQISKLVPTKNHTRIIFLYLRGSNSIYLIGGKGSGADSLIQAIGAIDAGAETLPHPFNVVTSESLIATKADVILVMTKGLQSVGGVKGLLELPGVAQIPAGKKKAIIAVDDSLLLSFGPRTPDLVRKLSSLVTEVPAS